MTTNTQIDAGLRSALERALADQVAHMSEFPPREARYQEPRQPLHALLQERLARLGLDRLFTHQAEAYDGAMGGEDLVVVTGTNSGKTLCYNLPALQMGLSEPAARMMYLFPTKALAQDQLGRLEALLPSASIRCGTYDGDTPANQRGSLRRLAHIILTNPDMLHVGILPGHELWAKFLKSLRLVVIDELHVYRGVFGSHVGNVIRRLLRLCEWHRSRPQIIACSATIGNPEELFTKLTGRRPRLIDEDGSPRAKRTFLFWNPPLVGESQRMSANVATSEIVATLAEAGVRTLAFSRARVSAELVLRYARRRVEASGAVAPSAIESYRAGYTPKERRQIESALFKGDLVALSATNAMELGVDVGGLDAVIMNGYPGTVSSFWQQAGRAGRGSRPGMAVMVAHDDPLEQFLVREPAMLLNAQNENVAANPQNPQILAQHLRCAAHERPLAPLELGRFGENALELAEALDRAGDIEFKGGLFYYPSHDPPAPSVNIRGSGSDQVVLMLEGKELGTMERWRAMQNAHTGAIYLHRGASYLVKSLNLDAARADVLPMEADYYTQAIVQSSVEPRVTLQEAAAGRSRVSLAGISVTDQVVGFRRKTLDGESVLSVEELDMPPQTFETLAVRLDLPMFAPDRDPLAQIGGVHGLEHALMAVAPFLAGCDRGDIGSSWYSAFPGAAGPVLFIFDRTPGGVGLSERLFDLAGAWYSAGMRLLRTCECDGGCPSCLMSPRCEANNEALDKRETLVLLQDLCASC